MSGGGSDEWLCEQSVHELLKISRINVINGSLGKAKLNSLKHLNKLVAIDKFYLRCPLAACLLNGGVAKT